MNFVTFYNQKKKKEEINETKRSVNSQYLVEQRQLASEDSPVLHSV